MPDYFNSSHNKISPELQGSVLWGILGSVTGIIVCILVMLLCALFQMSSFSTMLQLFTGLVIGWFYRLFHGRRSKTAAYVTVGICTVLASVLWVALLALLSVLVSPTPFTDADWGRLWGEIWELLLLCVGLGMVGFFLTRRSLLAYADWKRGPWLSHTLEGMGIPTTCFRKNFPPPETLYPNWIYRDWVVSFTDWTGSFTGDRLVCCEHGRSVSNHYRHAGRNGDGHCLSADW